MKRKKEEVLTFPISYKVDNGQIIVEMDDDTTKVIPYTILNEKNILNEIEKSLSDMKDSVKNLRQFYIIFFIFGTLIVPGCFLNILKLWNHVNIINNLIIHLSIIIGFTYSQTLIKNGYIEHKYKLERIESFLEGKKYIFNNIKTKEKEETLNNKQTSKNNKAIHIEKLKTIKNELMSLFHQEQLNTEKDNMLVKNNHK